MTAAIECYLPEKSDTAYLRSAYQKLFVICNAKTQYSTSNMFGNAVVCNNNKPESFLFFGTWTEQWSTCRNFSLTKQTLDALITTPKALSCLLSELLNDGHKYVHTTPFQKDPFERHIGGGRFLVKLRKVKNSENFLRMSSIVKENINFWEEEVFINNDLKETVLKIEKGDITNNEREF